MQIIELRAPVPRPRQRTLPDCDFGITGVIEIPRPERRVFPRLDRVLDRRHSRREFVEPLGLRKVGDLLWYSMRVRKTARSGAKSVWESRPAPSGGGCHPVHVVLIGAHFAKDALLIYNAEHHAFGVHAVADGKLVRQCVEEVDLCLKVGKGTVFWFVADLARTGAKYRNPESLVWRDSGALLATFGLVAEALGINCCGLGLHEIYAVRKLLKLPYHLIGVGGCIVSGRSSRGAKVPK